MKKLTMLMIVAVLITQWNCVTWYTNEPEVTDAAVPRQRTVPLHYAVMTTRGDWKASVRRGLDKSGVFSRNVEHTSLTDYTDREKGSDPYFLEVFITERQLSGPGVVWTYLTWYLSFGIVPGYTNSGVDVSYRMYQYDNAKKSYLAMDSYTYDMNAHSVTGLIFIPLMWINFVSYSRGEAIGASSEAFLARMYASDPGLCEK